MKLSETLHEHIAAAFTGLWIQCRGPANCSVYSSTRELVVEGRNASIARCLEPAWREVYACFKDGAAGWGDERIDGYDSAGR